MIVLNILLFIALVIAVFGAKGDFLRPGVIVSGVMFAASIAATYLCIVWSFELKIETLLIIVFSVAVFIFIDFIISRFFKEKRRREILYPINIPTVVLLLVCLFCGIAAIWHYMYLVRDFGFAGSLTTMISTYRKYLVWGVLDSSMPSLLSRMERVSQNFSFIFLYIYILNIVSTGKFKKNFKYLLPVIIYVFDSMLWGARGYIVYIIFAAIVYWYIIKQKSIGWKQKEGIKFIKSSSKYIVVGAFGFIALGTLFGRSTDSNIIYRFAKYLGGGIALFNDYLIENTIRSPYFGASTFTSWNNFMTRRFGRVDLSQYFQFEFRAHDGISWGNVYTALRRYYQDFGFLGTIVMVAILSVIFGILYSYVKNRPLHQGVNISLLYYGILVRALFLFFFDDEFFNDFITPSTIVYIVELLICLFVIGQIRLKRHVKYHRLKGE